MSTSTGEIAKALCAIMADVRYIRQSGENTFHRYKYASDADLLLALQPAMARHGIAIVPTVVDSTTVEHVADRKGKAQYRTDVLVTYLVLHTSGESLTIQAPGCGIDGEDKGVYKAMTGALKYALRHTFHVPTGDDAELEAAETARREHAAPATWQPAEQRLFFASLVDTGVDYEQLKVWLAGKGKTKPSRMSREQRGALLAWLAKDGAAIVGGDNVGQ